MGTMANGKKWAGVCVNGKTINGLAKNGVVFYKKMSTVLYKRRIMVGDNLTNKTMFLDFNQPWIKKYKDITIPWNSNIIVFENGSFIDGMNEGDYFASEYWLNNDISITTLWEYGSSSNPEKYTITQSNSSVSSIDENSPFYKNFYIEDPNIRPVQVGDKITNGTKVYFIFPDTLENFENKRILSLDTDEGLGIKSTSNAIYVYDRKEILIEPKNEDTTATPIFNDDKNLSIYIFQCSGYRDAIPVNFVDQNLIKYVLVDKVTLGS